MRKQIIIIAMFILGTGFTNFANAQKSPVPVNKVENSLKSNGKYAIMVQNPMHFMVSIMTGEEYRAKGEKLQFEIVLIGDVVKDLAENKELDTYVRKAEELGIRIVVCEFAMNKFGIKKSQYLPYVETTPNGFTYIFGLQELGFKTITL